MFTECVFNLFPLITNPIIWALMFFPQLPTVYVVKSLCSSSSKWTCSLQNRDWSFINSSYWFFFSKKQNQKPWLDISRPLLPLPITHLASFSHTDVFISDNSGSMQSAATFPASRYKLIEGNQRLSIQLACVCLRSASLQHGWLLETSHRSIELLSPLLLPSW